MDEEGNTDSEEDNSVDGTVVEVLSREAEGVNTVMRGLKEEEEEVTNDVEVIGEEVLNNAVVEDAEDDTGDVWGVVEDGDLEELLETAVLLTELDILVTIAVLGD